jgi:site-specific DNA recombinase
VTNANGSTDALPVIKCAVYTRKSTEEGLQQEFNTLDAQRESGEAYIKSQAHEGWTCLPDRFDDGGFTGANMDRPGLARLLADIESGRVNAVIVYKVDRLSRSLLDFARLMQIFDDHKVAFVSVTQSFNSATSMGRLVLNVLLSFAQFEREIISERTRDKLAATRKKGKWTGGHPILGYDLDRQTSKLGVNADEAVMVRAIFELYLDQQALLPVVRELARRDWVGKRWTTKAGRDRGGKPFDRTNLYRLLTSPLYTGRVPYKGQLFPGEHQGIVDLAVFERVQQLLNGNGQTAGIGVRNKFGALLKGILHCGPCGCSMSPAHSCKNGKRYRYYCCTRSQKRGKEACPSRSVPAAQIEDFVVAQIRRVGQNPEILQQTLAEARRQTDARLDELDAERRGLERELARLHGEVRKLAQPGKRDGSSDGMRLAELPEQIVRVEERIGQLKDQTEKIRRERIDEADAAATLAEFDKLWQTLSPVERTRVVRLLIERVEYDAVRGKAKITFSPTGIRTLTAQLADQPKEMIA